MLGFFRSSVENGGKGGGGDRLRRIASQLTEELKATSSPRSGEFLDWLNAIVERAERASSVEGFEVLFEAEHVFGPDDDKGFYPSRYGW